MARDPHNDTQFGHTVRRIMVGVTLVVLLAVFLLWRIDNPRAERLRAAFIDRVVPNFEWALLPVTRATRMIDDFQSYARIYEQNQELRRELQRLKSWREAALQLEQENASLLDLNKVRLDPKLTFITGVVLTDSGSPFRQSALINVGRRDGIIDGWATMDGLGLVGRITGVGENTSRVVLLTDDNSRIPVTIQPSGRRAIMSGDNTAAPIIQFLEDDDKIRPGDRVFTSGDGGVFPPALLAGQVARASDGRLRVRLAADYRRLEFLRILRATPVETIAESDAGVISGAQPATDLSGADSGADDG